jgi:signal transduction histidine kinase
MIETIEQRAVDTVVSVQDLRVRYGATIAVDGISLSIRRGEIFGILGPNGAGNVAKHAHANRVGLTLSYMEDLVTLDVRDDGIGFQTVNGTHPRRPRDDGGGFGLTAMRQRVEGVAGTLEIESEPDGGTAISASVPAVPVVTA